MAHEISVRENGFAEAAFALQPAWHGLGQVLSHVPTSEEMIVAAGLDWTVNPEEVWTQYGKVSGYVANTRSDSKEVLGVVSDKYQLVQNRDAFAFLDGLTKDGVIRYEAAGALKGGRRVWALARMPGVDTIAEGDDVLRYVLFATSHDGSHRLTATPTSVRVVCANTMAVAEQTELKLTFRHSGNMQSKLQFAQRYIAQFNERFDDFRDKAKLLASKKLTGTQARDYIEKLFPVAAPDAKRATTVRETKVAAIRQAYANERQKVGGIGGTWWSMFNAVTEYVDHVQNGYHGSQEQKAESKFINVTSGDAAEFKRKAFAVAMAMAI